MKKENNKQPVDKVQEVKGEKQAIKTDKLYRPYWVNEDHLKTLGYELDSDKDGYIKYQSSWLLKAWHPTAIHEAQKEILVYETFIEELEQLT